MRRKRGKPLLLKEPEEYHGGAVFWSLRKVKEARDRRQLKEREEEQLQHQKAEANRHREEASQSKAEAVQARRQAAARRTYQRLKQALNTSQKGKKRSLKPPAKATSKKITVMRPTGGGEPQGAVAGEPVTTRPSN
jgi:ATPase subunit of ABC transporter with duplicated ATPase domains